MREQTQTQAGKDCTINPCFAVRFVPVSGVAAYPRDVKIGNVLVTVTGPDWWPVEASDRLTVNVSPSDGAGCVADWQKIHGLFGGINTKASAVSEGWLVESAQSPCEMGAPPPLRASRRVLWSSVGEDWSGAQDITPGVDVRGFSQLYIDLWSTDAGNGCGLYTFFWSASSSAVNRPSPSNYAGPQINAAAQSGTRLYILDNAVAPDSGTTLLGGTSVVSGGDVFFGRRAGAVPVGAFNVELTGVPR